MKIHEGIPNNFKGMGWNSSLQKIGISVQMILNPGTLRIGMNYKRASDNKSMSVVIEKLDHLNEEIVCQQIREFEIKEFQIPAELSPYAK